MHEQIHNQIKVYQQNFAYQRHMYNKSWEREREREIQGLDKQHHQKDLLRLNDAPLSLLSR